VIFDLRPCAEEDLQSDEEDPNSPFVLLQGAYSTCSCHSMFHCIKSAANKATVDIDSQPLDLEDPFHPEALLSCLMNCVPDGEVSHGYHATSFNTGGEWTRFLIRRNEKNQWVGVYFKVTNLTETIPFQDAVAAMGDPYLHTNPGSKDYIISHPVEKRPKRHAVYVERRDGAKITCRQAWSTKRDYTHTVKQDDKDGVKLYEVEAKFVIL